MICNITLSASYLTDRDVYLFSAKGSFRPILLKNSALVSTAENYASEIEILIFG